MVALESTEQKVTLVQWFSIMFCPASPWRQKCFHNCFSNAVKKFVLKKYWKVEPLPGLVSLNTVASLTKQLVNKSTTTLPLDASWVFTNAEIHMSWKRIWAVKENGVYQHFYLLWTFPIWIVVVGMILNLYSVLWLAKFFCHGSDLPEVALQGRYKSFWLS